MITVKVKVRPLANRSLSNGAAFMSQQEFPLKKPVMPQLVNTRRAAEILGRSPATLKRWRYEGVGPNWIEIEGRVSYDVAVLLEYIRKNTRVASVRAAIGEAREAV